jgi:CheY-specific phosphatase CheX
MPSFVKTAQSYQKKVQYLIFLQGKIAITGKIIYLSSISTAEAILSSSLTLSAFYSLQ